MAQQYFYAIQPDTSIEYISSEFANKLSSFGYNVQTIPISYSMVNYNVIKVGSDLEKFAGLLPEFRITLSKTNDQICINVEDVWTSKILACGIGWFLCGIGLVTGLIGVSRQSSGSTDIQQAMAITVSETN